MGFWRLRRCCKIRQRINKMALHDNYKQAWHSLLHSSIKHFHKWLWIEFSFAFFLLCRVLSCIQAGACNIRSYWQTHGSSVRGLVWMRRTYSGKVVTACGHFVTRDKPSASCCRLPPQLVLSRFKKKQTQNRLLPAAIEKTPLRLYSCFTHRHRERI